MITIDRSKSVARGKCADVCPTQAIITLGDQIFVREGLCRACGACVEACPKGAITMMMPSLNPYPQRTILRHPTGTPFDSTTPRSTGRRHRYGRRGQ